MVTIAHLSDPHLAPLPRPELRHLLGKRVLGYMNWHRNRRGFHIRAVADLMTADIASMAPDHVVVTGDLVNLALPQEFGTAARWLEGLGNGARVSVVPGNHDAYVAVPWDIGIGRWQAHMTSCHKGAGYLRCNDTFPFVRVIGKVALIGLSSAVPMPWYSAGGRLGANQISTLQATLRALRDDGLYRIALIHHPPLPGQNVARKALQETAQLRDVLVAEGVDMVLHGHNHRDMIESIETCHGSAHIVGVPSASAGHGGHRPAAQYNIYKVTTDRDAPVCQVTVRGYDPQRQTFETMNTYQLERTGSDRQ